MKTITVYMKNAMVVTEEYMNVIRFYRLKTVVTGVCMEKKILITEQEQIEFAKIPYTEKEISDYDNDEYPDYFLWCDCGKKVMIGSDFFCLECDKEQ